MTVSAHFLDSSALAKRYVQETGSNWVNLLLTSPASEDRYISRIAHVEINAALARRRQAGALSASDVLLAQTALKQDMRLCLNVLEITPALIEEAATMADTHGLRAYDAVQLASALVLHRHRVTLGLAPVVLVSADLELNAAAIAEGMTVDDPNQHP